MSAIIGDITVTYGELSSTEIRYISSGIPKAAKAFHTDCWISADPLGPVGFNNSRRFQCTTLGDVAVITAYASVRELERRAWPQIEELKVLQDGMNCATNKLVRTRFIEQAPYFHKVSFRFSPQPQIVVSCADCSDSGELLGVLAIDTQWQMNVLSCCDERIFEIMGAMQCKALPSITKEIIYE